MKKPNPETYGDMPLGHERAWLLLMFFAALVIRLWQLDGRPIWVDEGATVDFAIAPAQLFWSDILLVESNPPGYYAFMRGWVKFFGISDFAIRLPSSLASSLIVFPMYLLARRYWGHRVALTSSALLILSGIQVAYAQEARSYAFISLFFMAGLWFADTGVRRFGGGLPVGRVTAGLAACCVGMSYAHFTGLIATAVVFVYQFALLTGSRDMDVGAVRFFLRGAVVVFALVAPVVAIAAYQISLPTSGVDWIPRRTPFEVVQIFRGAWGHSYLPDTRKFADAALLIALVAGVVHAILSRDLQIVALSSALIFLVLVFLGMELVQPILITRVLVFAVPAILLIAAVGCHFLPPRLAYSLMPLLLIALAAHNLSYYERFESNEPWDDIIADVAKRSSNSTALIHIGAGSHTRFLGGGPDMTVKYWRGTPRVDEFFATDGGSPLDMFMIRAHKDVRQLSPDLPCPVLEKYEALEILSRSKRQKTLHQLRTSLRANGSTLLQVQMFGRLINERWTAPDCRSKSGHAES